MRIGKIVGFALLGMVLISAGLIGPAQAQPYSGYGHWRRRYAVRVQRRPYHPQYGYRRIIIVGPSYWRDHRVVYAYGRPYYYRRYIARSYVR